MRERLLNGDLSAAPHCADYARGIEARLGERLSQETGTP
jgi:hypothetical protein